MTNRDFIAEAKAIVAHYRSHNRRHHVVPCEAHLEALFDLVAVQREVIEWLLRRAPDTDVAGEREVYRRTLAACTEAFSELGMERLSAQLGATLAHWEHECDRVGVQ